MSELNKAVLRQANAAIRAGDYEGFLSFCAEDIQWSTVGGDSIHGVQAVRESFAKEYSAPPVFSEDQIIADGDYLAVLGNITTKDHRGMPVLNAYCDIWRFTDGKLAALKAFVITTDA